jgi:hypothetical protein
MARALSLAWAALGFAAAAWAAPASPFRGYAFMSYAADEYASPTSDAALQLVAATGVQVGAFAAIGAMRRD